MPVSVCVMSGMSVCVCVCDVRNTPVVCAYVWAQAWRSLRVVDRSFGGRSLQCCSSERHGTQYLFLGLGRRAYKIQRCVRPLIQGALTLRPGRTSVSLSWSWSAVRLRGETFPAVSGQRLAL